jgi:hypothetical protein
MSRTLTPPETPPQPPQESVRPDNGEDREPMLYCPICSVRLGQRKCKLFCEKCGYYMSCADYI